MFCAVCSPVEGIQLMPFARPHVIACLIVALFSCRAFGQSTKPAVVVDQSYFREHYTKYEYMVPMRDGVKLLTAVYAPKDDSTPWPILLTRTPYGVGPYGVDRYPKPRGPMQQYA